MGVAAKPCADPYQPTVATNNDDGGLVVAHTMTTAALRTRAGALLTDRKAVWAVAVTDTDDPFNDPLTAMHTSEQSPQHVDVDADTTTEMVCGLLAVRPVQVRSLQLDPFAWDDIDTLLYVPTGGWILRSDPIPWPPPALDEAAPGQSFIGVHGCCVPAPAPNDPFWSTIATPAPEDTP